MVISNQCCVAAFAVLLTLQGFVLTHADDYSDAQWEAFKARFNKEYDSPEDETEARFYFEHNQHEHFLHNLKDEDYTQDIHEHSDKPARKAIELLCRTRPSSGKENRTRRNFVSSRASRPSSLDWVNEGYVLPVKDQGSCGSCYAFGAVGALEGQIAKQSKRMYRLSEQQIVDCSFSYGNDGCDGGSQDTAFKYLMANGGSVPESCYPYKDKETTCNIKKSCDRFKVKDFEFVDPINDEEALANALHEIGPITVSIHVDDKMSSYSRGVFSSKYCNHEVNHAVLLVGYGVEGGVPYWKVKNSWGTDWGEKGYIKIARNKNNMCRIAEEPSYPVLP